MKIFKPSQNKQNHIVLEQVGIKMCLISCNKQTHLLAVVSVQAKWADITFNAEIDHYYHYQSGYLLLIFSIYDKPLNLPV